ncbi:ATP-binding protein [Roseisolibacter agri]|uniref:histidine kinase n=1 Tax=Roseisolibacter agri TaxID=2014610 RepID=A0AA37Q545_9BACT|nr:ATP-binding protein [Roseisolibacter agri]GLC23942.1 hypothetical protein rosag_04550 [Roseisolibacter agri]
MLQPWSRRPATRDTRPGAIVQVIAAWVAAAAITVVAAPFIPRATFVFFWAAVLFAAWRLGLVAAIAAAVAAVALVDLVVLPPGERGGALALGDLLTLGVFVTVSVLVSALAASRARAQALSEDQTLRLQEQAVELELQAESAQSVAEELELTTEQLQLTATEAEEARAVAEAALEAERAAADRASRLLTVTTGLSRSRTPEEVADVIFTEGLAALGADAGTLALLHETPDGREFETVRAHGYPEALVAHYRRFPLRAGRPLSDALLTRTPRWLSSREAWRRFYPEVVAETGDLEFEAFVAIPVTSGDETLGGFSASFREPREFDAATRTFLATLGEQCGLALARARAFVAEHQAREFTAEIVGSVRDGFVALDAAGRFTFVNARAKEMLRRPAAELLGLRLEEAFPASVASAFVLAAHRVLTSRAPEVVEAFSPTLHRWMEGRLYPSARGGLTIFFEDVTARRHAREASDFLVEATRVLSASLDHETTLRTVARAAVPRLGDWCAVDVLDDPMHPVWPPRLQRLAVVHDDPAKIALGAELQARYPTDWSADVGMAAVLRSRTPLFVPVVTDAMIDAGARDAEHARLVRALGLTSLIAVPLVARGVTLGALTLAMSESGRRYDEADLALAQDLAQRAAVALDNARLFGEAERAREEAVAANRAKSQFLSTMSHELRTPLNAIAGYTELLEMGVRGPVTDDQREDLTRIRRGAKVLMSLVNDVLNFARVEAGQVDVHLEDVRLDLVLADLEVMVAPQLQARRLTYALELADEALAVRADADRLKQILSNLLTNAVKFTDEGGRIVVSCDVPDAGRAMVRVCVRDSGRGIPDDKLAAIFEPFVQVDRHLTRDSQQGVGLGLAISRDLARAMRGELTVESRVGEGSIFALVLPRAGAAAG